MDILLCANCGRELEVAQQCIDRVTFCSRACAIEYIIDQDDDNKQDIEDECENY